MSKEKKAPVAASIDVGFGVVKYAWGVMNQDTPMKTGMFPALAPRWSGIEAFESTHLSKRRTTVIRAGNHDYEVGPQSILATSTNASRTLDQEYSQRETYLALVLGALRYMELDDVDILYLGLPVSSFLSLKDQIPARIAGVHPQKEGAISIRNVRVVPQPMGGMYDIGVQKGTMRQMRAEMTLMLDPGYFTFDYLLCNGTTWVPERSSAADNNGMSAILRAIGDSIGAEYTKETGRAFELTESVLMRLDESIVKNQAFKYSGRVVNLANHMKAGQRVVNDGIARMVAKLGTKSDIDNVILVGGSHSMYRSAIEDCFPDHTITVPTAPIFSNVRGYQMMALLEASAHA